MSQALSQRLFNWMKIESGQIGSFKKIIATYEKLFLFWVTMNIEYLERLEGKIKDGIFFYVKIF